MSVIGNDVELLTEPRICFITAIHGRYESRCNPFVMQNVPADFICFTDNAKIKGNGWQIDTTPYHFEAPSSLDNGTQWNSMANNKHTFNISKYYKQAFYNIPRLAKYDAVVWIDGTIEIISPHVASFILSHIQDAKIITWHHEKRYGSLAAEVADSNFFRYNAKRWFGQEQQIQYVSEQYEQYLREGYRDDWCKLPHTPHGGVWLTCFIAFSMTNTEVRDFIDEWYSQTLNYTTQDQVSFPYVCWKRGLVPLTLPCCGVDGDNPHKCTDFFIKHEHLF